MSLIGDALRKARQDTSPGRESGFHAPSPPPPWRRGASASPGKTMALGLLLGALAAVAGGAGVWFLLAHGSVPPREASAARRAEAAKMPVARAPLPASPQGHGQRSASGAYAAPSPTPARPGPVTKPGSGSALERLSPRPVPAGETGRQRVDHAGASTSASAAGQTQRELGEGSGNAAEARRRERKKRPRKTKNIDAIGEARIGTVKLSLDYIVYRSDNPFAQINGEEAHIGTDVAGYIVTEITSDYVVLRGETSGRKVTLRVR